MVVPFWRNQANLQALFHLFPPASLLVAHLGLNPVLGLGLGSGFSPRWATNKLAGGNKRKSANLQDPDLDLDLDQGLDLHIDLYIDLDLDLVLDIKIGTRLESNKLCMSIGRSRSRFY